MSLFEKILNFFENRAVQKHKTPAGYNEDNLRTLDELADSITCGSVLMCSGTAAESRLIEQMDGTDFSHAAMIVKFHNNNELLVWTADTVKTMVDEIKKEENLMHSGCHLLSLKKYVASLDKLYPSPDGSKYRYAIARLKGIHVNEKKLWDILFEYDGTPFPETNEEFLHALEGIFNIDSGINNSYCAQMVAQTYIKMGWLNDKHPANHYNPGSFAKTEKINKELLGSACLEKPEYFIL